VKFTRVHRALSEARARKRTMAARAKEQMELAMLEACAAVVLYDGVAARDFAIEVCDSLARKFIGDTELEITWWRFRYLADPVIAREAAQAAAKAALILVFLGAENIPRGARDWFERWLSQREAMEGALVVGRTSVPTKGGGAVDTYLRLAAERAHLDYLPLLGPSPVVRLADKLREDWDRPPDYSYRLSGWGINE
jgi:hypothetical protein